MTRIKNINQHPQHGTTCSCGSWLNHWESNGGGNRPTFCIVGAPDCLGKAEIGAFVQKANINDGKWYLAPLCSAHSHSHPNEFLVYNTWALVEVDVDDLSCLPSKKKSNTGQAITVETL